MKRFISFFLVLMMLMSILACGTAKQANVVSPGKQEAAKLDSYKVAVLTSSTGPYALLGTQEYEGIKYYADKINKDGGIKGHSLELIYYDIESKPELAVSYAQKAIEKDKVLAVIGLESLALATPVIPVAEGAKVPLIAAMGMAPPVGSKYTFASFPSGQLTVYGLVWYASNILKINDVGILAANDGIGQWTTTTAMPTALKLLGKNLNIIGTENFNPQDTDVTTQLQKLSKLKPGAIILAATGQPQITVAKNIKQLGLGIPVLTYGNGVTPEFINLIGNNGDALLYSSPKMVVADQLPDSDPQKKATLTIAQQFQKDTGKEFSLNHSVGYDSLLPLVKALEAVGPDKEALAKFIENSQQGLQGAAAKWNRTPQDHVGVKADDYSIITIKDKKVKLLEMVK